MSSNKKEIKKKLESKIEPLPKIELKKPAPTALVEKLSGEDAEKTDFTSKTDYGEEILKSTFKEDLEQYLTDKKKYSALDIQSDDNITLIEKWNQNAAKYMESIDDIFGIRKKHTMKQIARIYFLKLFNNKKSEQYQKKIDAEIAEKCMNTQLTEMSKKIKELQGELSSVGKDYAKYQKETIILCIEKIKFTNYAENNKLMINKGFKTREQISKDKQKAFSENKIDVAQGLMEKDGNLMNDINTWEQDKAMWAIKADTTHKKQEIIEEHIAILTDHKRLMNSIYTTEVCLREIIDLTLERFRRYSNPAKISAAFGLFEEMKKMKTKLDKLYDEYLTRTTAKEVGTYAHVTKESQQKAKDSIDQYKKENEDLYQQVISRRNNILTGG